MFIFCNKNIIKFRTFNSFIKEHKEILDYLYITVIKDFKHITLEDFYNFAFDQSTVDNNLSNIYIEYGRV
jgi:hypothetical protein